MPDVLLNPGPVNLSEGVRRAQLGQDICHREPEYAELLKQCLDGILAVYGLDRERFACALMVGSGTAAVEAAVLASLAPGQKLLVVCNGVYGERMRDIAACHGLETISLDLEWGAEIPLERLEELLAAHEREIWAVALVHHETTTGALNPLGEVGPLVKKYGKLLLVDGVSSFAGEEMDFEGWGIDLCAVSANKCLHSVPGAAFVILSQAARTRLEEAPRRSVYLDLKAYLAAAKTSSPPFTPAVQAMYALRQALAELAAQGVSARIDHYRKLSGLLRQEALRLGLRLYLPEERYGHLLTSFHLPEGVTYDQLHDYLRSKGFVIYTAQGQLQDRLFRLANMGEMGETEIRSLIAALEDFLK